MIFLHLRSCQSAGLSTTIMKLGEFVVVLYLVSQFLWHFDKYANEIRYHYHIIYLTESSIIDVSTWIDSSYKNSSDACDGQRSRAAHSTQPVLVYKLVAVVGLYDVPPSFMAVMMYNRFIYATSVYLYYTKATLDISRALKNNRTEQTRNILTCRLWLRKDRTCQSQCPTPNCCFKQQHGCRRSLS